MINVKSKIFLAGHNGLVGSAILRSLIKKGYRNILTVNKSLLDLTKQKEVLNFLKKHKPEFIFIAAAKVGGIHLNSRFKADMIYQNLTIQTNLIHAAYKAGVKNLIFLGSSCVYPRNCKQPIKEEYLLTSSLENSNDAYAIAKIAGIKMCESYNIQYKTNYKCIMPTNTFGPNDKYHLLNSHFFPALIKKIHNLKKTKNKTLKIWGDGKPRREMIYVDDLADACTYFMKKKIKQTIINIGTGKDYTIKQYVEMIAKVIIPKKKLNIKFDKSKPNGTPRKLLDISLSKKYGWKPKTDLNEAIYLTYQDFLKKNEGLQ